ncbi:MAG: SGNH/GDSL hydrolase family protein [Streptosporangiaceae bacterium]
MRSRIEHAGIWLSAAAALALVCAAGCGAASPSYATSGLEKQVSNGERISAATRAHAAQQQAGAAAAPAPATIRRKIAGAQVTAIGDSVMAASAMALEKALPGIYIDAVPSRQMPAGLAVVRHLAATGRLRQVLVIGLGTNYIVTTNQLDQLLRILGPGRQLVLVNTYVPDEWSKEVNATDARFIRQHPSVVLADWYDTIRNRIYLLWPDHVHPEMPGTSVYARMVYRAVQATRNVSAAEATRGL